MVPHNVRTHGAHAAQSPRPRVASSTLELPPEAVLAISGPADENLRIVEDVVDADILTRGNHLVLRGEASEVSRTRKILMEMAAIADHGQTVTPDVTRRIIDMLDEQGVVLNYKAAPIVSYRGKAVRPKTLGQEEYVEAIDNYSVVFGLGPAGTGKTYLAMAKAVQALQAKEVTRIILTRPAVEAGRTSASCPAPWATRSTPTCAPSTTRCGRWWTRRSSRGSWSPASSRSPRWPICAAAR